MSNLPVLASRSPRRRRRWTAADKAGYLRAFRRSGLSVVAFCRDHGVSPSTFARWQRVARSTSASQQTGIARLPARLPHGAPSGFARVDVVGAEVDRAMTADDAGMRIRMCVRGGAGTEAELAGLDAATAIRLVELVLHPDRRRATR